MAMESKKIKKRALNKNLCTFFVSYVNEKQNCLIRASITKKEAVYIRMLMFRLGEKSSLNTLSDSLWEQVGVVVGCGCCSGGFFAILMGTKNFGLKCQKFKIIFLNGKI